MHSLRPLVERARLLVQVALVAAIVGGGTAALVAECSTRDEDERAGETTTTQGEVPPATPPVAPSPPLPPAEPPLPETNELGQPIVPAEPEVVDAGGDVQPTAEIPDGGAEDAETLAETEEEEDAGAPPETTEVEDAGDAGAPPPEDPWRGPSFSAGAGRFLTEPPPWAASTFTPNPEAGAGLVTSPPPWAASTFTPNSEAGAGEFTTERNTPAPFVPIFLFPLPRP